MKQPSVSFQCFGCRSIDKQIDEGRFQAESDTQTLSECCHVTDLFGGQHVGEVITTVRVRVVIPPFAIDRDVLLTDRR
jgi:hypothetical protein